jgi:hypothetical protein
MSHSLVDPVPLAAPVSAPSAGGASLLGAVEKAVLLTVHYRDLFGHAVREEEIARFLIGLCAGPAEVQAAIQRLTGPFLAVTDGYVTWRGRERLVEERRQREANSVRLWALAHRVGAWARIFPFIRMVAVTGSLAVNHAGPGHDIDLLCVARRRRVWPAVLAMRLIHYRARRQFRVVVCPNCVLDESDLLVRHQNLYLAHQVLHMQPLWGLAAHAELLAANRWVVDYLPNWQPGAPVTPSAQQPQGLPEPDRMGNRFVRRLSRLTPSWVGDQMNQRLYQMAWRRALAFYRPTHPESVIAEARRPGRYMMPGIGYGPTVYRRFLEGADRFADVIGQEELKSAFGGAPGSLERSDARFDAMMARRYEKVGSASLQ